MKTSPTPGMISSAGTEPGRALAGSKENCRLVDAADAAR
jgi:hypothetical protein